MHWDREGAGRIVVARTIIIRPVRLSGTVRVGRISIVVSLSLRVRISVRAKVSVQREATVPMSCRYARSTFVCAPMVAGAARS